MSVLEPLLPQINEKYPNSLQFLTDKYEDKVEWHLLEKILKDYKLEPLSQQVFDYLTTQLGKLCSNKMCVGYTELHTHTTARISRVYKVYVLLA